MQDICLWFWFCFHWFEPFVQQCNYRFVFVFLPLLFTLLFVWSFEYILSSKFLFLVFFLFHFMPLLLKKTTTCQVIRFFLYLCLHFRGVHFDLSLSVRPFSFCVARRSKRIWPRFMKPLENVTQHVQLYRWVLFLELLPLT
jgi:hypothetical protein